MKVAAISTAVVAALVASAVAVPSFAQDYRGYGYEGRDACGEKIHKSGTTGALLGGLAGALIGANLASHHGGRAGGAVLGGLAGAALGNNIARSSTKSSGACEGDDYYNTRYAPRAYYDGRYEGRYAPAAYRYEGDAYNRGYEPQAYSQGRYESGYDRDGYRHSHYDGGSYRPY